MTGDGNEDVSVPAGGPDRDDLLESLAALEHRQWRYWTEHLVEREGDALPDDLVERWRVNWRPYDALDDEVKEHDRKWAREVLEVLDDAE